MPACQDQDPGRAWCEAGEGCVRPPGPGFLMDRGGVGLFASLHGVIDDQTVVDEYAACKEVTRSFHLEVIDIDSLAAHSANHGNGVTLDLWCTA